MSQTPRSRRIIQVILASAIVVTMTASAFALHGADEDVSPATVVAAPGDRLAIAEFQGVESVAVDVASKAREVPTRDGEFDDVARYCDAAKLKVIWTKPEAAYKFGAYIEPLGPAPGPDTAKVNGIVICEDSTYAYMGFEAVRTLSGWEVIPVPVIDGEDHGNDPDDPAEPDPGLTPHATIPKAAPKAAKPGVVKPAATLTAAIETYAGYDAQATCSSSVKPGVAAFKKLVLSANPVTRSLGVSRGCSVGGRSEHKEGRAWDWGANVTRPAEKAAADKLIAWLFATDEWGNRHAMARRLGIMYIVYNRKIWGAYRVGEGWRAYNGASPHTDHVHFSFAWPGAQGKTSFWTGKPAVMPGGNGGGGNGNGNGGGRLIDWRERRDDDPRRDWRDRNRDPQTGWPDRNDDGRPDWRDRDSTDPQPDWRDRDSNDERPGWRDRDPNNDPTRDGGDPSNRDGWTGWRGNDGTPPPGSGTSPSPSPGTGAPSNGSSPGTDPTSDPDGNRNWRNRRGDGERPSYRKRRGNGNRRQKKRVRRRRSGNRARRS